MSSIYIDFGYDDNVKRSLNSAKRAISSRISDYQGIQRELNNTTSHTNNLSTANTYIQKKIDTLQDKYNRLDRFAGRINNFNDNATAIDRRVADRINTETNQFYKRENIPHGFLYTIGSAFCEGVAWLGDKIKEGIDNFVEGCKAVWETVKQWYEENKYWIDIVVDVVCVVAAAAALLASGGAVAAVFAVWGLANAVSDLVYDVAAYGAYKDGDMELYEELSGGGLKDVMTYYLGDAGEAIYYGMEIASALYSVHKLGKAGVEAFKEIKKLSGFLTPETFKACRGQIIKQVVLGELIGVGVDSYEGAGSLKNGLWHGGKLIFTLPNLDTPKFVLKTAQTWFGSDSLLEKIGSTFSVSSTGLDIKENIEEMFA